MQIEVMAGQCAMDQLSESAPGLITLVGLAGLLTDSADNAHFMALSTAMEVPIRGFHTRRQQAGRKDGHRGLRHARLV